MKALVRAFTVIALLFSVTALAEGNSMAPKTPQSVTAKLYWAAKLMDRHENWRQVSELLREVLDTKLDNDYVTARVKAVKQYVDREWVRQDAGAVAGSRLDTHSFLEARLLIVECLQEMRPRMNLSWTGEVRLFKKMLFTALFPHAEAYGKIEFPKPETYAFDIYGYTMKNLKALMITRGGQDLSPLFSEFLAKPDDKKKPAGSSDWDNDEVGSNMYFRKLSSFKDRIYSTLMSEGVNPDDRSQFNGILPGDWDSDKGTGASGGDWGNSGGGWGNDDWDWHKPSDSEQRLLSLKKAYVFLSNMISTLRNHRSIDEYEPLTLMMIAVSNPAMIEEDPQLKDFVAGLKFKLQLPINGMDGDHFKPTDYHLVELVNDALSPTSPAKLQFEVDGKTGQTLLYIVSNFNGSTNIALNMLSFRNVTMFVQAAKYMPDGVISFAKATPENITKLTDSLNKMIEGMRSDSNFIYKIIGAPAEVVFDLTIAIGGKTISKVATATGNVIGKVIANPRVAKGIDIVKSEGFLRTMVALSVASDLTAGIIEYHNNTDPYRRPQIITHTTARISSALVYLLKYKPAIWGAVALDLGHLMFDKVPSVSDVAEYLLNYSYDKFSRLFLGGSPMEKRLADIKAQLGIHDNEEGRVMLAEYEQGIKNATDVKGMDAVRNQLASRLGVFAARRLVFHYVTVTSLDGHGDRDLGFELRNQFEEYDRLYWLWFTAPGGRDKEQAGLALLDHDFDEKYVKLGGKLPEPPKADPKPASKPADTKTKDNKDKGSPWDDLEQNSR